MARRRSLRNRLLLGNMLWAVGQAVVVAMIATALVLHVHMSGWGIHYTLLGVTAVGFIFAGLLQLRLGLAPLKMLRDRINALRKGSASRVDGEYAAEIQPLVDDLNALLDDREQRVARAIAKAGDLAHGLKTPLAVLSQEGARAKTLGHDELATTIDQQVTRMRRQIEYHLAHARAAASGGARGTARSSLKDAADGLARTLLRLHADRGLAIDIDVAADQQVRVQLEDLEEMLGNLLDNACKWAKQHVRVSSTTSESHVTVFVDDDGAGLDPSKRHAVLQRGVRADEALPGSGLGLAIVRDLAELYGGSISLDQAPDGGVRARLMLPR